jgi:cation:H+ antiporter
LPVSTAVAIPVFVAGTAVALGASFVLVSRLERVGERLGLSEALLGVLAALAADAPEITAAVTALVHHEQQVGAGVVIGSNVFNLAALLGLSAVIAGRIRLHRRVIAFAGTVATAVAVVCLAAVVGVVGPVVGLALALVVLGFYLLVLGEGRVGLRRLPGIPRRWAGWLGAAVAEEEMELAVAIRPRRGRPVDTAVAALATAAVVGAAVAMERAASSLGDRLGVPEIVVGGLVLAAVTSLPNAVAANYLAARGRGAAVLATALTSNDLNVTVGLLLPGALLGLGPRTGSGTFVAAWYAGMTAVLLVAAYRDRGLRRGIGWLAVAAYAAFVVGLVLTAGSGR